MTEMTTNGIQCAIDAGLITMGEHGPVFHFELLPTEETRACQRAREAWEAEGANGLEMRPTLTECVNTAVKAGVRCPQDVGDWLRIDYQVVEGAFIRCAIDHLILSGMGNAAIRDYAERNGWPVTTARVATRRRRIKSNNNPESD